MRPKTSHVGPIDNQVDLYLDKNTDFNEIDANSPLPRPMTAFRSKSGRRKINLDAQNSTELIDEDGMSVSDITLGENIRSQNEINVHQGCFGEHLVNVFIRRGVKVDKNVNFLTGASAKR